MRDDPVARLMECLSEGPLRDRFAVSAAPFVERRGRDAALRALEEKELRGLALVLASQPAAARYLSLRPALLERLAHPGTREAGAQLEARARALANALEESPIERAPDLEQLLDELRLLRRDETLWAACLDLGGRASFEETSSFLSRVAEHCLRRALLEAELHAPEPARGGLAVLGMGRVAGRELTYHSDLDLVFLYRDESAGAAEPARIAQRLIVYLSTMTGAGVAYVVDSRLRPSGRQGALVSPFLSFERYQLEQAALWEHLALMRARPIAGLTGPAEELLHSIRERLRLEGSPWPQVDRMRRRVEAERGARAPGAFKTGAGGLMDVDFLATGGLLEQGPSRALPAIPTLLRCHASGRRVDALLADYTHLRRVESRARWVVGRPVERIDLGGPHAAVLAELIEPGGTPSEVARELAATQARIRACYERVIAAGSLSALGSRPSRGASSLGANAG